MITPTQSLTELAVYSSPEIMVGREPENRIFKMFKKLKKKTKKIPVDQGNYILHSAELSFKNLGEITLQEKQNLEELVVSRTDLQEIAKKVSQT